MLEDQRTNGGPRAPHFWWEDRSDRSLARRLEVLQLTEVFMSFDIGDIGQLVTLRSVLDWITNRAREGVWDSKPYPPQRRLVALCAIVEDYMDVTSASQSFTPANLNLFIYSSLPGTLGKHACN